MSDIDPLKVINDSIPVQIIVGALIGFVVILIVCLIRFLIYRFKRNKKASPYLINGNSAGNSSKIIYQDPNNSDSIPLLRSRDEKGGIEFSYTVWLYVTDWVNYKSGLWKHVFHKGSPNSFPPIEHTKELGGTVDEVNPPGAMIAAPGLWFHPAKNSLRLYMNTYNNMNEYIDIDNIPSNKWYHLSIIVKETSLNIYINGYLKEKHNLSSLPRQNFGNAFVSLNGGFSGTLANLRYYDYALTASQVLKAVGNLPNTVSCSDSSGNGPPYLNTNWWQNEYN